MANYPWSRFVMPFQQALDSIGVALPGALLYFYESGTATPLDTYQDQALTIPNTNPVVADATGTFSNIFLQNESYKVVLKDSNDDEIWTADPVSPFVDAAETLTSYYDFPVYFEGKPTDAETYPIFNVPRDLKLPASLTGSIFTISSSNLPTSTMTFTLYKNAISIGTIVFSTSGTATVTFLADVTFAAGDQFSMIAPSPQDATGEFIAMTFVFTVL